MKALLALPLLFAVLTSPSNSTAQPNIFGPSPYALSIDCIIVQDYTDQRVTKTFPLYRCPEYGGEPTLVPFDVHDTQLLYPVCGFDTESFSRSLRRGGLTIAAVFKLVSGVNAQFEIKVLAQQIGHQASGSRSYATMGDANYVYHEPEGNIPDNSFPNSSGLKVDLGKTFSIDGGMDGFFTPNSTLSCRYTIIQGSKAKTTPDISLE